jgi:hypothetical protein
MIASNTNRGGEAHHAWCAQHGRIRAVSSLCCSCVGVLLLLLLLLLL